LERIENGGLLLGGQLLEAARVLAEVRERHQRLPAAKRVSLHIGGLVAQTHLAQERDADRDVKIAESGRQEMDMIAWSFEGSPGEVLLVVGERRQLLLDVVLLLRQLFEGPLKPFG